MLNEILREGRNPHEQQYANALVWATPDEDYAKGVTTMRFMVRLANDENYQKDVRNGTAPLPSLAKYSIKPETRIYNAEGNKLEETDFKNSNQFVIEAVETGDVKNKTIDSRSTNNLLTILDSDTGDGLVDTVARATIFLDKITESNFCREHDYNFDGKTFGRALSDASRYYLDKGLDKMQVEEMLAKGLFSGSFYMGRIASKSRYES